MTVKEARDIVRKYGRKPNPTDEEQFMFTEAMGFLIEEEHDPDYMMWLGGYYYEQKRFDLALKYYEMAATYDDDQAYRCLGYIWYYGRTGEKDYKKAYEYFSKLMDKGDLISTYKVADMYKNGYYVAKDENKYEKMITDLYSVVKDMNDISDPVPEVFTRLAGIRHEHGDDDEAISLYLRAKDHQAQRIRFDPYFGNMNIMKWLIDDLYEIIEFDVGCFDFYDLYYLLKMPNQIVFMYRDNRHVVESVLEGDECSVCFDGEWFHDRDDFFENAYIVNHKLTQIYDDLYGFEVI